MAAQAEGKLCPFASDNGQSLPSCRRVQTPIIWEEEEDESAGE